MTAAGCWCFDVKEPTASNDSVVVWVVVHETVTARVDGKGLPHWQEALYAAMERNAAHVTEYFRLPGDQVVEIGRQIAI